ncbi:protein asteroid homolog 1-like isoform X2 [Archocentrus centrarchus]|uniref:protein asteroid homolog 1-like isoform X2 n=1 Tax=Archocentrus centrarchus TaxID=63155 RepID=UPI0011E9CFC9|nr:protein asteroid homolog 1-like isoform X2 [Archocentrus centrarchus]
MGVQGLATLLDNHRSIYRDVEFRRSRLVIDGSNLVHLLYFESGLDQNHGGEYAAFENLIERFFTALRTCEVEPYVVLDGGSDPTDKKLETVMQRAEQQIEKAHRAAVDGGKENILPVLAMWVFKQRLFRLKVPIAQCFGEADREIAALAYEWQCPVLSNDSDFYIFNLPAGMVPISYFQWADVNQNGSKSYIPCKRYYTSSFCIYFEIQHQLLPTFAALAGNDYVKLQKISWVQFAPKANKPLSRLVGLLCWLKDFEVPQEALEAAMELMGAKNQKKEKMLQSLSVGIEEYQLPPSSLTEFFKHGVVPQFPEESQQVGLVPDWIQLAVMQARMTADILDVLLLHSMSLSSPVSHKDLPSVNLTSRPLRQVMYGLLLGKKKSVKVEECDREGLQLKCTPIKPIFSQHTQQLELNSLHEVELSVRLKVLLEALRVQEELLNVLPPQLRLPVAVTCYWCIRARPPPDLKLLKSLVLGMCLKDTLRLSAAVEAESRCCHQKADTDVAHAFSQWQVCMKDSMHLNQLLDFPLPEPDTAGLYQGMLVHQLVHMMRTGRRLKRFLKTDQATVKRYRDMLFIVHQLRSRKVSKFSAGEQIAKAQRQPLNDHTNLQLYEDEDVATAIRSLARVQEELQLDDQLMVKTRYRTKERRNRCNKVELTRKEERRGIALL